MLVTLGSKMYSGFNLLITRLALHLLVAGALSSDGRNLRGSS